MINEIHEFNTKLLGVNVPQPTLLPLAERNWLLTALHEEIDEFLQATEQESIVDCVDSLLDLVYFAIGGCVRLGLKPQQIEQCFNAIHSANMAKKMGIKESRPQDGSVADAIKPAGWVAPEKVMKTILFPSQGELDL